MYMKRNMTVLSAVMGAIVVAGVVALPATRGGWSTGMFSYATTNNVLALDTEQPQKTVNVTIVKMHLKREARCICGARRTHPT
jgi:23S rRNA U2552 (ribose-2'-O)-methylase RlmE/FtsJ